MKPPGRIRIIGGSLRGSRLDVPDRAGLRPTPDRLRETLFNWLMPVLAGSRVLDVFAGSGVLALEALSRGATAAVAVDCDHELARSLAGQAVRLRVSGLSVVCDDALTWLRYKKPTEAFDVVFLDPPFGANLWAPVAMALDEGGWLKPNALIYVESPRDVEPVLPVSWVRWKEARVGEVIGVLWRSSDLS